MAGSRMDAASSCSSWGLGLCQTAHTWGKEIAPGRILTVKLISCWAETYRGTGWCSLLKQPLPKHLTLGVTLHHRPLLTVMMNT